MLTKLRAATLCAVSVCFAAASFAQGRFTEIGNRVSPAVVKLVSFDENKKPMGLGSGFLVGSTGLIVTNYHVIRGGSYVVATCANHETYEVQGIVDFDPTKDFAILKITGFDLPIVELGNSNSVQIGEEVMAIGHPLGHEFTLSNGVISQFGQKESFRMLQTTTPVSPGNSGGPLVNLRGQVVGIVTEQETAGQNLNFALPINYVRASLESNVKIQYSLGDVAKAQADSDKKAQIAAIKSLFQPYKDKYEVYEAVVPKAWKTAASEGWSDDQKEYVIASMLAPESAARAEVNGYLSEGIRVHVRMPPQGKVWKLGSSEAYAPVFAQQVLNSNTGFVQTSSGDFTAGQQSLKMLEFIGENRNIAEPEKDRFYILGKPECLVEIECVSPASQFKDLQMVFEVFMKTFEFKGCPSWKGKQ